ncbi:hypothetical protein D3C78_1044190 [compost metagenome]
MIELGLRMLQLLEHQPRVGQQHLAVIGESQAAGGSDEQWQLLSAFQFTQGLGDGGLGHLQRAGGGADAAGFGTGDQRL